MTSDPRQSRSAFTLVEMLVSIGVLALIMTFIAQMMNGVSLSTTLSSRHIDTDNQARLVFDRMAMDFAGMPQRTDVQFIFAKQDSDSGSQTDPSDKMFFFSEAPAYFSSSNQNLFPAPGEADPKSDTALIGYIINSGSNNTGTNLTPPPYCLQRLSQGLTWDQGFPQSNNPGGLMFLTFDPGFNGIGTMTPLPGSTLEGNSFTGPSIGTAAQAYTDGTSSNYVTLANQVFRMEYCFEVKDLSPGGSGGAIYSQYPVAAFTDSIVANNNNNTTFAGSSINTDPPTNTNKQGGMNFHVGDRWYNNLDHLSFICTSVTAPSAGATPASTWVPNGLADVNAIVVAIAVMDSNSRKTLSQSQLQKAASYLPDFNSPNQGTPTTSGTVPLMATVWQQALDAQPTTFAQTALIPQFAASQIRVYQHVFYLNNN